MKLSPEIRKTLVRIVMKYLNKPYLAELFAVTTQTVLKGFRKFFHRGWEGFKDELRNPKNNKITVGVSNQALRNAFELGTAKIQQAL